MTDDSALSRVTKKAARRDRPKRKSKALSLWMYGEIIAAKDQGYSLREIRAALSDGGFEISYNRLSEILRRETDRRLALPVIRKEVVSEGHTGGSTSDPLANSRLEPRMVDVRKMHNPDPSSQRLI